VQVIESEHMQPHEIHTVFCLKVRTDDIIATLVGRQIRYVQVQCEIIFLFHVLAHGVNNFNIQCEIFCTCVKITYMAKVWTFYVLSEVDRSNIEVHHNIV
jgi:hypothetical protein